MSHEAELLAESALYEKYRVERTDGRHVGPCFVLELDNSLAWIALLTWAETLDQEGQTNLAAQVRKRVLVRMNVAEKLTELGL